MMCFFLVIKVDMYVYLQYLLLNVVGSYYKWVFYWFVVQIVIGLDRVGIVVIFYIIKYYVFSVFFDKNLVEVFFRICYQVCY